jgi:hypothetical protein
MDILALHAARVSGKSMSSTARFDIVDAEGRRVEGHVMVKDYMLLRDTDNTVLRLQSEIEHAEAPPKPAASVIADLLGFVVPSTPENDAFFESLNSQLDRQLIDIDSCSTPMCISHPVAPVPSQIICRVLLHSSVRSRISAGSTSKTFAWDSSITCEMALLRASAHWFPDMPGSNFMFKAYGRFEYGCHLCSFVSFHTAHFLGIRTLLLSFCETYVLLQVYVWQFSFNRLRFRYKVSSAAG